MACIGVHTRPAVVGSSQATRATTLRTAQRTLASTTSFTASAGGCGRLASQATPAANRVRKTPSSRRSPASTPRNSPSGPEAAA
ncbi:hypothetical protein ASD33_13110 [Streptomyces sp. Root1304]|nr:hypothetical protein ASD33_13110 [Streptomyces sp. Root1304]